MEERKKYRIKKNDMVMVIAVRKRQERQGDAYHPQEGRAIVEKLNMVKRHLKPSQQTRPGGILEKESPFKCQPDVDLFQVY